MADGDGKKRKPAGWGDRRPNCTTVLRKDISKIAYLGSGAQGLVEKVRVPFFGICVVKYLACRNGPFNTKEERDAIRELIATRDLAHHPNITDFYGLVQENIKGTMLDVGFITEYMEGGNLTQVMNSRLNEDLPSYFKKATRWSVQIARALAFCHSQKVMHRDIKPDNMLLSKDHLTIKICDFGFARPDTDTPRNKTCNKGTREFMAPEMIAESVTRLNYKASADVYSFGMFLYTVYNRKFPFLEWVERKFDSLSWKLILTNGTRPDCVVRLPTEISSLMTKCWDTDPTKRPKMDEVVGILEKYWNETYVHDPQDEL